MKNLIRFSILSLLSVVALLLPLQSHAITMGREAHDGLIEKLRMVRESLVAGEDSYIETSVRLTELLTDRARMQQMEEIEKQCEACVGSKNDRKEALKVIASIEKDLKGNSHRGAALMLKGHLMALEDQTQIAIKIFKELTTDKTVIAEIRKSAMENWADLEFRTGNFKQALSIYQVLPASPIQKYRVAWCHFQLGKLNLALRQMEAWIAAKSASEEEKSLKRDALRDLALLYARASSSPQYVVNLLNFSDAEDKVPVLTAHAQELDRLGKKSDSALIWLKLSTMTENKKEKNLAQAQMFRLYVHMKRSAQALELLKKMSVQSCTDADGNCQEIKKNLREGITDWAKEEKLSPSKMLTESYFVYASYYPDDADVIMKGASLAQKAKQHQIAFDLLGLIKNPNDVVLQSRVREAEETKKANQIEIAYKDYLQKGQDQKLKLEIQLSYVEFLKSQKRDADYETQALVVIRDNNQKIQDRKEVADSYLAALAKANKYDRVVSEGADFAKILNDKKYAVVSAKAKWDMIAVRINQEKSTSADRRDLKAAYTSLQSAEDKKALLLDFATSAQKDKDISDLNWFSQQAKFMLPQASPVQKTVFQKKFIYIADLQSDFKSSYFWDLQLNEPNTPDREARLALKARLMGQPNLKLEKKIMSSPRFATSLRVFLLREQLKTSARPEKLIKENIGLLKSQPQELASVLMESMNRMSSTTWASYVKQTSPSSLPHVLMKRRNEILTNRPLVADLERHRVTGQSDSQFQKTLARQAQLMKKADRTSVRDPMAGLFVAAGLVRASQNLASDVKNAPAPRGMKEIERKAYYNAVAEKAKILDQQAVQKNQQLSKTVQQMNLQGDLEKVVASLNRQQLLNLKGEFQFYGNSAPLLMKEEIKDMQKVIDNEISRKKTSNELLAFYMDERKKME